MAASTTCGFAGSTASRFTKRQSGFASGLVEARYCQVLPPSSDLNAPAPTSPALASPVPAYTIDGLDGSKAIVEMERFGRKSLLALQLAPPSEETHSPPEAVPARSRDGFTGSKASERTRPPTLDGPSACHCEGCRPADFSRIAGAGTTSAERCCCARRSCQTRGGPFSSASLRRL
jgi:hypothetical protein